MVLYLVSDAMNDDVIKCYIQQGMEQANEQAISRAAKVQVFSLCSQHYTPSMQTEERIDLVNCTCTVFVMNLIRVFGYLVFLEICYTSS